MGLTTHSTGHFESGASGLNEIPLDLRPARSAGRVDAAKEWRHWLTGLTLGLLLFELLTGLFIYLLPFSVFNQLGVVWHTVLGVAMLVPTAWYLGRHWWLRYHGKFNHVQLLGYLAFVAIAACLVSGVVLTWQALFATRIEATWDFVHLVSGIGLAFLVTAHLLVVWLRKANAAATVVPLRAAKRAFLFRTATVCAALIAVHALSAVWFRETGAAHAFPEGYSWKYGADRPFAPSLARKDMSDVELEMKAGVLAVLDDEQDRQFLDKLHPDPSKHEGVVAVAEQLCSAMALTEAQRATVERALARARQRFQAEGAIPPRHLSGSAGCGTSGCHSDILEEWLPSAHRYASMDFVFQAVQTNLAAERAPEATRYCAGCHDPIALFSGAKNVGNVTLSAEGADEGVSCLACHSMVQTDVRGNGDYTIQPQPRYLLELEGDRSRFAKAFSDFLIRAYPRQHVASYTRSLYKTAEACGACHKQFVDEELNQTGWVQGQNQYDSWRKSRWHVESDDSKTISCRECHMPLLAGADPASGDLHDPNRDPHDGKHRSHRFLGANQFIPRYSKLEGAEEHCDLTVQWLRGAYPVPEIADRWTDGPVVRLGIEAPDEVRPGEDVTIRTVITNNKAGHDFPTGPMDMIEGWVELTVTDESGTVVFASARPDEKGYLVNPQIVFKAELINNAGNLIGRHELWELVGARFKRVLFPGFTDTTAFSFACPAMPKSAADQAKLTGAGEQSFRAPVKLDGGKLKATAVVWYTKFSAPFLDRLFGAEARVRSEVTEIARAEAEIRVVHEERASAE